MLPPLWTSYKKHRWYVWLLLPPLGCSDTGNTRSTGSFIICRVVGSRWCWFLLVFRFFWLVDLFLYCYKGSNFFVSLVEKIYDFNSLQSDSFLQFVSFQVAVFYHCFGQNFYGFSLLNQHYSYKTFLNRMLHFLTWSRCLQAFSSCLQSHFSQVIAWNKTVWDRNTWFFKAPFFS